MEVHTRLYIRSTESWKGTEVSDFAGITLSICSLIYSIEIAEAISIAWVVNEQPYHGADNYPVKV